MGLLIWTNFRFGLAWKWYASSRCHRHYDSGAKEVVDWLIDWFKWITPSQLLQALAMKTKQHLEVFMKDLYTEIWLIERKYIIAQCLCVSLKNLQHTRKQPNYSQNKYCELLFRFIFIMHSMEIVWECMNINCISVAVKRLPAVKPKQQI